MRHPTPAPPEAIGEADGLAYSLWLPAGGLEAARGGVVVLHGAGSRKESHHDFARAARGFGFAAVAFDQRGHGTSGGRLGGGALDDVETIAALLAPIPPERLVLRGSSMGGYLALLAADRLGAGVVIAVCPASAELLRRGLRTGRLELDADVPRLEAFLAEHDEGEAVERYRGALMILHAERDERIPAEDSRALHERSHAERKQLVVVPGGHHRSVQHDPELQGVSLRFAARALAAGLLLLLILLAAGCGEQQEAVPPPAKLRVAATTTQVGDLVERIAGDRVAVSTLMTPSDDPHTYAPGERDVKAIATADLILRSGAGLDRWAAAAARRAKVDLEPVDLAKAVTLRAGADGVDPHWWLDPQNVEASVAKVRDELIKADPDGSSPYILGARAYLRRVRALDRRLARCFARLPAGRRAIATDHDAFGYFAARYRLRVVAALNPTLSPTGPPSERDLAAATRAIARAGAPPILLERGAPRGGAERVATATGAPLLTGLFADSLGPDGSAGATLLQAISTDARVISGALGGASRACRAGG